MCLAQVALAAGPAVSLRPVQRGGNVDVQPRPLLLGLIAAPAPRPSPSEGLLSSLRPVFRPQTAALPRPSRKEQRLLRRGAVCGDIAIQGEKVGRVPGSRPGCGVKDAVRITSVSGIALSQGSVMDCGTANALKDWVDQSAKPALRRKGGGLESLKVAAHYVCRTRNHRPGAKISEHGKGRAIDISAFRLANGEEITVSEGWNARRHARAMRRMHKGACQHFGTVLGPEADRFHKDHFHFDTAKHRSGSYCR
jgi:hypothetical protein